MRKTETIKNWIPIKEIREKGIVIVKKNSMIKIIKIKPINFNLKTEIEKQAIMKAYHDFLKTCNFNIQILIQSRKENLAEPISFIQLNSKKEQNKEIKEIANQYINYIQKLNRERISSSKNFFLIIKENPQESELRYKSEEIVENGSRNLQEKYLKIKEGLSHCGNQVTECSKQEVVEIIKDFFNRREKNKESENF